jgi:hypothetical protein
MMDSNTENYEITEAMNMFEMYYNSFLFSRKMTEEEIKVVDTILETTKQINEELNDD